jgi:hypothetical protein
MSLGVCACPCDQWGHGGVCDGRPARSLPTAPHLEGWAHKPCCEGCYLAIQAETDRRALTPKQPGQP